MAILLPVDSRPGDPHSNPDLHDVANRVHEEFDDHLDPSAVDEVIGWTLADRSMAGRR